MGEFREVYMQPGVFQAKRKNGEIYYRANITYLGKHISIGSYDTEEACNKAYLEAKALLSDPQIGILSFSVKKNILPFNKYVSLIANPPYMGRNNMNDTLTSYLDKKYKEAKQDLYASFMQLYYLKKNSE